MTTTIYVLIWRVLGMVRGLLFRDAAKAEEHYRDVVGYEGVSDVHVKTIVGSLADVIAQLDAERTVLRAENGTLAAKLLHAEGKLLETLEAGAEELRAERLEHAATKELLAFRTRERDESRAKLLQRRDVITKLEDELRTPGYRAALDAAPTAALVEQLVERAARRKGPTAEEDAAKLRALGRRFRCVIMDPPYVSGALREAARLVAKVTYGPGERARKAAGIETPIVAEQVMPVVGDEDTLLTPVYGGHVFAGTWEQLEAHPLSNCAACGSRINRYGSVSAPCTGWPREGRGDALRRVARAMIRDRDGREKPNGPHELAVLRFTEALNRLLDLVDEDKGPGSDERRAAAQTARRRARGLVLLLGTRADELGALELALEASDPHKALRSFMAALPSTDMARERGPVEDAFAKLDGAIEEHGGTVAIAAAAEELADVIRARLREVATFALAWRNIVRQYVAVVPPEPPIGAADGAVDLKACECGAVLSASLSRCPNCTRPLSWARAASPSEAGQGANCPRCGTAYRTAGTCGDPWHGREGTLGPRAGDVDPEHQRWLAEQEDRARPRCPGFTRNVQARPDDILAPTPSPAPASAMIDHERAHEPAQPGRVLVEIDGLRLVAEVPLDLRAPTIPAPPPGLVEKTGEIDYDAPASAPATTDRR